MFRVAVEGNIGAGKTTLLSRLAEVPNVSVIFEPVSKWQSVAGFNLLDAFYQDKAKWAFTFQTLVQLTSAAQMRMIGSDSESSVGIYERSLHSSRFVFAEQSLRTGNLQPFEMAILDDLFNLILTHPTTPKFDLMVYLRVPPEVCFGRMVARNRSEESSVPYQYINELHELHEDWLIKNLFPRQAKSTVVIDGNRPLEAIVADVVKLLPV